MKELIDDTKKFNEIYKKLFKEYFDKPLKQDGFYKQGTITFRRLNKLGMLETLNFQRHYDKVTVNCSIVPIFCGVLKNSGNLGKRLGYFFYGKDYWWSLKDEETMKKSMAEMLETIKTHLYDWFSYNDDENNIFELISKSFYMEIHRVIAKATAMAKFKRYDKIQFHIDEVKKEYIALKERGFERDWIPPILEEALLLEEKLKKGHQAVDEYIIEREKQSLREKGLEKLIKEKE